MANLRIIAICSNIAVIGYALVLNLPPILVLHVSAAIERLAFDAGIAGFASSASRLAFVKDKLSVTRQLSDFTATGRAPPH